MLIPQPQTSPQSAMIEKLLVKGRHGQFVVIPEDLLVSLSMLYYGEYHEHEWQFVKRFLNLSQVIVDAGANLGTFTVPFAKTVGELGKVISFEPQPVIFGCLRETIALNQLNNVELYNCCIGNGNYELEIAEPDYTQPGNFSGLPFQEEGFHEVRFSPNKIRTTCVKMDEVLNGGRLDFLKIDVEGMELEVLQGGEQSIARYKPVIYLENNRPQKSPPLVKYLMDHGYRLWWHTGGLFNPNNFNKCEENIYGVMHNINNICLPPGMDESLISPGMKPVTGPEDHVVLEDGKVIPSFANDVTGI